MSSTDCLSFTDTQQAFELFDSLAPVVLQDLQGVWLGVGVDSGHPWDGVLEAYGWHGKYFESIEHVHPLLFKGLRNDVAAVHPVPLLLAMKLLERFPSLMSPTYGQYFRYCLPLLNVAQSHARLRMTEYRGVVSASMIYDSLPIIDVFRRIDESSVLGVMDLKGNEQPLFFRLHRQHHSPNTA